MDFLNDEMVPNKALEDSDGQSNESISASNIEQKAVSHPSQTDQVHDAVDAESFLYDKNSVSNKTPGFNRQSSNHMNVFESMSALSEPP